MQYLSVCSGIESVSLAWEMLGWSPVAFSEIEPFPCAVLAHHYPGVPNWGDMTRFKDWPDAAVDVLVGGTPCQSFSVAGLRGGLADPRGNLCLTYLAIADRYRPRWLVWENVPGVLSSGDGRDFGAFIGGLEQLGYHAAWRVLDAQFVRVDGLERAVPQRRRRLFVVGYLGDWRRAAAVLFERESLCWDRAPRRKTGQRIAPTVEARANAGGAGWGTDFLADGGMAAVEVAPTMRAAGNQTGGHRPPGTDVDTADSLLVAKSIPARSWPAHREDADTLVAQTVSAKWSKGNGGPAGDECQNLVVADPVTSSEGKTYTHEGKNNFRTHNVVAFQANAGRDFTQDDDRSPPLRSAGAGGVSSVAVAFAQNSRDEVRLFGEDGQSSGALSAEPGMKQTTYVATQAVAFKPSHYTRDKDGSPSEVTPPLSADADKGDQDPLVIASFQQSSMTGRGTVGYEEGAGVLRPVKPQSDHQMLLVSAVNIGNGEPRLNDITGTIDAAGEGRGSSQRRAVLQTAAVRRLTPRECERLQGFPDDYTLIPFRNKPAADGNRYRALGNSMAVNCMRWLGQRIALVEEIE